MGIWYMRDNHTFRKLSETCVDCAVDAIAEEYDAGWTHGMLCAKGGAFPSSDVQPEYKESRDTFLERCRSWLEKAIPQSNKLTMKGC